MNAQHLLINHRRYGQEVKDISAELPDLSRSKLLQALVVETIHLSNHAALVVTAYQRNMLWVLDS